VTAPTGSGLTYSDGGAYQSGTTFSGLTANNYNITVKNASGCVSSPAATVINTQPATPAQPTLSATQPTCTVATGTITVTAPTGSGLTYSDGGAYQSGTTFSGLTANSYSITVQNAAGCISSPATTSINAQPNTPAQPTLSVTQPTCTVATGTITVTAPLGSGLTYSDGGAYQSGTTFSGLTANSYNITVQNAAGCISSPATTSINAQPNTPAQPTLSVTQPTCTVATGTITVTAPLGSGLTYSDSGAYQPGTTFSGLTANNYNITVKNASGCVSSPAATVINTQPATPAQPTLSVTQPTCTIATGTITVTAPTGSGLTYSDGGAYQPGTTFSGLTANSYNITVQNAAGCISSPATTSINAQPNTPAQPTLSVTQPTCTVATGTITVTAPLGSGLTYSDGGAYQSGTTFSGLTANSYSITVQNAAGCISSPAAATINTQPATPAKPVVTVTQPTCTVSTGTITVTSPTGTGYTYSDGGAYQTSPVFSGLVPNTYNITVMNAGGCISVACSVVINAAPTSPAAPTVTVVQPTCTVTTGTITVTAPTGTGYTYSDGGAYQASPVFSGLAPGSYKITVMTSGGCVSTSCTTVQINTVPAPPAMPAVTVTQPTCSVSTGTITVTSPTGTGYTYSDGGAYQSSTVFSGLTPGSYHITVKNSGGCVSASCGSVTINPAPAGPSSPTVTVVQPTCTVTTGTITVTAPTGTGYTYSDGGAYQTSPVFSGLASGSYKITVMNASGCVSTSCTTVVINGAPTPPAMPSVTITQPTCTVETGTITVTSPTGTGYTYSDGGAYQSSTVFSGLAPGSYHITVKNSGGCVSASCGSVTINPAPVVSCSIEAIPCNNTYTGGIPTTIYLGYGPQTLTLSATAEGGSYYTYAWTGSDLSCTNCANPVFTPTAAGTFTFTLKVTSNTGCVSNCSITICVIDPRCGSKYSFCHNGKNCVLTAANCAKDLASCSGDHLGTSSQVCGSEAGKDAIDNTDGSSLPGQSDLDIKVYPNPFASQFHLNIYSSSDENVDVKILDITGQLIFEKHEMSISDNVMFGDGLASGIYFVQVIQGEQTKVVRIIKSE
jgi:uncharacterized protein (UPF0218 family)